MCLMLQYAIYVWILNIFYVLKLPFFQYMFNLWHLKNFDVYPHVSLSACILLICDYIFTDIICLFALYKISENVCCEKYVFYKCRLS